MNYDVRSIKDMNQLISYFSRVLDWEIDVDSFDVEELAYDFNASDLGLKEDAFTKIRSLKQLPPLIDDQPWGIFSIEFDSKRFEVTALRKVLSALIPKQRNASNHAVWEKEDLLFLCFWGEDNERTIGIAHFEDKDRGLPQIKMISCSPAREETSNLNRFVLRIGKLTWPADIHDKLKWQSDWSSAFTTAYKQTIHDSETLTKQLASEAIAIRDRILETLNVENEDGYVHRLYGKFRETLIHDMTETQFADMYAQTVVYGLFSARCMDRTQEDFSASEAVDCIPNTNPFLKSLMKECLGSQDNSKLSFDELEIGNVVELLKHTNTEDIISDFNRQTGRGKEDTVIHFYEKFLEAYDKSQKVQRGVYYTPLYIVDFIVRAVDSIIKTEFGIEDGLASTSTKRIDGYRYSKNKWERDRLIQDKIDVPAIQVLDPATGTGTFIRQTILKIYDNVKEKNKRLSDKDFMDLWNEYVPSQLLPRINAFELMMAPYAVAHMKLALALKDTGYDFNSKERLNVFLTNSLEKPGNSNKQIAMWDDPLASESVAANAVKKNPAINVIIGNPPYNVSSINKSDWINELIKPYKEGLSERKLNLDDDYIKFIRFAQVLACQSANGIVGFITNNSYIDGITHRQMRKSLMQSFSDIYIIDLHGNVMKHEKCSDGSKDENVFDITQGVAICIMVKNSDKTHTVVHHFDLMGTREVKQDFLMGNEIDQIEWTVIEPDADKALFVPFNSEKQSKYNDGIHVDSLFNLYNSGIQTKCDSLSVGMQESDVDNVVEQFKSKSINDLRLAFPDKSDSSGWCFEKAKEEIVGGSYTYTPYYYRPFDVRYSLYTGKSGGFIGRSREVVMQHVVNHKDNLCLCMMKQFFQDTVYNHILVSNLPIDERTLYSNRGGTYLFPLYVYKQDIEKEIRLYNFNADEIRKFEGVLNKKLTYEKSSDSFTGEEIIDYIYAVLYSNKYRNMYNEYLKYDFPVIPLPVDELYFDKMVSLGRELISIHLPDNFYRGVDSSCVLTNLQKYTYDTKTNAVLLNNKYVVPVDLSETEYEFEIGGYKPIQKWLKDRKGLVINKSDIECLIAIINCIKSTREIMSRIDETIILE